MKRGRGDLFRAEFVARGGRIEVLPTFEPAPITVRRAFHGGNFL